jgi:hypothetical protein
VVVVERITLILPQVEMAEVVVVQACSIHQYTTVVPVLPVKEMLAVIPTIIVVAHTAVLVVAVLVM